MPIDPSLFLQYAALRQRQNEDLGNKLGNIAEQANQERLFNKKIAAEKASQGLDLDKLVTPVLIKMGSGQELTPEEQAIGKAWDMRETRKLAPDATGNYRRVNASIFGDAPTPQGFDLGMVAPIAPVTSAPLPDTFAGGVAPMGAMSDAQFDAIPAAPLPVSGGPLNVGMLQPTGDPGMDAYRAKMFEQNGAMQDNLPTVPAGGFDTGLVAPPEARTPITVPPELANNPNAAQEYLNAAAKAQATMPLEVAKAAATETAKAQAEAGVKKAQTDKTNSLALPILYKMLEQNDTAPQMPYSDLAQPVTRFADPKAANSLELMKQNRLDLAAPLAKELGVNPTDKDFQASLDRIVDLNADPRGRALLIQQLINKTERKLGVQETKFENKEKTPLPKIEGKRVRQKSTGKTGQIINGEFVPD